MTPTDAALAAAETRKAEAEALWLDWLRIPSVSASPARAAECRQAAEFARGELAAMGFTATLAETAGHPVVLASHPGPGGNAPHLLYYGHYDVQPADPVELWDSPPFEPVVVAGPHGRRVVARGAVDDKGQVAMWLGAFRAWHAATGTLPCRVTAGIEGEEEVGSVNFPAFLAAHRAALGADIAVISDTGMWDIDTPAISTSLRGLVYLEVTVKGPARDLHSGMYGGSALNPINALTAALGQLHDPAGRIRIPGFYDGVAEPDAASRAAWEALGFNETRFLAGIGLTTPIGEHGRSGLERLWARPTADINGIWGGYTGPGSKTVIAAEASAKISFRLVPGQEPARIVAGFCRFMEERLPPDARLSVTEFSAGPGIAIPTDNRFVRAAAAAMEAEYGRKTAMIGCGGSIPIVEALKGELGMDSLLMGFGLEDDQPHSPNEKFEVACFEHGLRSHVRLLGRLGAGG